MTGDRIHRASLDPTTTIGASGLLAAFDDAGVLDPLDVSAASAIARLCGETDERVMLAAALAVRGTRFGHVCIRLATQRDTVAVEGTDLDVVRSLPWPDPGEWRAAMTAGRLAGDGSGDHPLVLDGDRCYLERYFRYEQRLGELVADRCRRTDREVSPAGRALLDRLLGGAGTPSRQHGAAVLGLAGHLTVIAGGPGTGKTYTVGAMLAALAADGPDRFPLTALCAPTGKAAARLREAIGGVASAVDHDGIRRLLEGVAPSTIHRLLGWSRRRGRFAHHERNRLPHDLVIVDEMSMVSLPMAAKLLGAVRDEAAVVMVGDPYQLESIEAGTVLADVVGPATGLPGTGLPGTGPGSSSAPIGRHVAVLERTHRFEERGVIADLAEAVRTGDADRAVALLSGDHDGLRWVRGRDHPGFGTLWRALVGQRARMVEAGIDGNAGAAMAALSELAVLCARRTGAEGVGRWGGDLESALDERFTGLRWRGEWYPGRPVMITRNDYDLDLYNGDIGVCIETGEGRRVVFERGGNRRVPPGHLGERTTVHAMTIHKSQGSQFDSVAVVLPGETSPLLTRELLYTAVTRASRRVHVVGDERSVRSAIARSVERASGLGGRLWGPGGGSDG